MKEPGPLELLNARTRRREAKELTPRDVEVLAWFDEKERKAQQQALPPIPKLGANAYRVIAQTDEWFMGRFDPQRLEVLLNELGADGWHVVGVTASDRGTWFGSFAGGTRQEMVVLLERVVDEALILEVRRKRGEVPPATPELAQS